MITKTKSKNMYINFKCENKYKRNFEGVSEIVRKIRIREHVQNKIVLLYEGQNVIMSDFYWLKNHKNPSWGQKLGQKNLQKILRLSSNLGGWSLKIPGNKTRHDIVPQVYMECITEPEILPRLPCIMWVIIVEPFHMERHGCRFLWITRVIKNFLNEILHVIATCCISR